MKIATIFIFGALLVLGFLVGSLRGQDSGISKMRKGEAGTGSYPTDSENARVAHDMARLGVGQRASNGQPQENLKAAILALAVAAKEKPPELARTQPTTHPHRDVPAALVEDPAAIRDVMAAELSLSTEQRVALENAVERLNRVYEKEIGGLSEILSTNPADLRGRDLVDRMAKFLASYQAADDEIKTILPADGLERFDLFSQISPDVMAKIDAEL